VDGPATGGQRHRGVGPFVPCRSHLDHERWLSLRDNPREEQRAVQKLTPFIAQRHVLEENPRDDEGTAVRLGIASGQPCVQWGVRGGGGNKPLPRQNRLQVFLIDKKKGQMRRVQEPGHNVPRTEGSSGVRGAPPNRIGIACGIGGHHSTTPKTPGINDRRGKREVENKTRTKQIDGEKPTVVFWSKNDFLKRKFFTGKFTIR
jgi:hypothetical protein